MTFEDFKFTDFPVSRIGVVYVFVLITEQGEVPFYVGETERFSARMDDYFLAQFTACTDFKVGEAIKYLTDVKKLKVVVRYKETTEREREEKQIIVKLRAESIRLLNDLRGYDYHTADENAEREAVQRFCEAITLPRARAANG